ncbi:MAG: T9SS type A sorting domain-containing protein [Bacteroidia bacterium]|nr:T9SS type A sorting domain-containing protein [Bacteroidia bacterium]
MKINTFFQRFRLIFGLLIVFASQLSANDECANAIAIQPGITCTPVIGSFAASTLSGNVPACAPSASQDIWFSFVATEITLNIQISAVSGLNHGFEIYFNNCAGDMIACVNNSGSGNSENYFNNNFIIGASYFIRVFNANTLPVASNFNICIQQFAAPANDDCADAIMLTSGETCQMTNGTFSGAGISTAAPDCFNSSSQDVWYKFTTTHATMSISLEASSGLNHGFELIALNCDGVVENCVNSNASGNSEFLLRNNFQIGQVYYIRVFNAGSNISSANFGICVRSYTVPGNNTCNGATLLTPGQTCVTTPVSLSGATFDGNLPACTDAASQDVWFRFVADNPVMNITMSGANSLNHGFELYQDSCSGALKTCVNDNPSGIGESYLSNNMSVGKTYFIRIFNAASALNFNSFTICVRSYSVPANDVCNNAIILQPGASCIGTPAQFGAASIDSILPACGQATTQNIWYKFTANQQMMSITLSGITGLNHGFQLYSGTCQNLQLIECVNSTASGAPETALRNNFVIGQEYYVQVFNNGANYNTANFTICIQGFAPHLNNTCSNPKDITPQLTCTPTLTSFRGASLELSTPSCASSASQDIWFRFKATDSTMSISLMLAAGINHGFEVYQNTCNGPLITCVNANGSGLAEQFSNKVFVPGEKYLVRVFNVNPTYSLSDFNICVFGQVQPCTASISISTNDTSVCQGNIVQFTASATNEGIAPVYQWKVNGEAAGNSSNTFNFSNPAEGDKVSCTLISNDPCTGNATVFSDTITLSVANRIKPLFSQSGPFCAGTIFTLPTISDNGLNGSWSPEVNSDTSTLYTFSPDSALCADTSQMQVQITPKISPLFDQVAPVCNGTSIELPDTSNNGIYGSWELSSATDTSVTYIFTPDSGQCASIDSMTIDNFAIDVSVTIEGNKLIAGTADATYQWVNCDDAFTPIGGEHFQSFTFIANGDYAVIINKGGCIDTSSCVTITTAGINSDFGAGINLYPNPVNELFFIEIPELNGHLAYRMIDASGRILNSGQLNSGTNKIETKSLQSGVYFLQIDSVKRPFKIVK